MKRALTVLFLGMFLSAYATLGFTKVTVKGKSGEELFQQHCSACHPDGGNTVDPQETLHKKDLDANKIKKPGDIVKKMRHPGPGMTQFDKKTVPDKDAKKIAEYILKTFK